MKYLLIITIISLSACSSSKIEKLERSFSQLTNKLRIQEDRIKELESSQVRMNQRIERSEFKNLSHKNQVLERSQAEQQVIDQTYSNSDFQATRTNGLEVQIANQTSSLVPLSILDKHRQEVIQLPAVAAERFEVASQDLIKNKFLSATLSMQELSKLELKSEWQARSQFWLGIAAEGMKDYKKAVSYYSNLIKTYPDFSNLSTAIYRQGNLFSRIGESGLAQLTYQKLIADHPNSQEAQLAKKLIN